MELKKQKTTDMVSTKELTETLPEIQGCNICFERFNNSERKPMIFACKHTLCLRCLNELPSKLCPFCKKVIQFQYATYNLIVLDYENKINEFIELDKRKNEKINNLKDKLSTSLAKIEQLQSQLAGQKKLVTDLKYQLLQHNSHHKQSVQITEKYRRQNKLLNEQINTLNNIRFDLEHKIQSLEKLKSPTKKNIRIKDASMRDINSILIRPQPKIQTGPQAKGVIRIKQKQIVEVPKLKQLVKKQSNYGQHSLSSSKMRKRANE